MWLSHFTQHTPSYIRIVANDSQSIVTAKRQARSTFTYRSSTISSASDRISVTRATVKHGRAVRPRRRIGISDISYSLSAEKHGTPFHNNCVTKRYYTKCSSRMGRSRFIPHNAIRTCHQQLHNAGLISQQRTVFGAREKSKLSEFQGQPLIMQTPRYISCKARPYSQSCTTTLMISDTH